jgi:ring-1,2-phenylacetyl-CoA epoxidase subunit PaaC
MPKPRRAAKGGRIGHHSEHLGHLLSEMQFLQRAYPGATW